MNIINRLDDRDNFITRHEVGKIYTSDFLNFSLVIKSRGKFAFIDLDTSAIILEYNTLEELDSDEINQNDYEVDHELILKGISK